MVVKIRQEMMLALTFPPSNVGMLLLQIKPVFIRILVVIKGLSTINDSLAFIISCTCKGMADLLLIPFGRSQGPD